MNCLSCRSEIPAGLAYCPQCGTRVPGGGGAPTCSNCGAPALAQAKFCGVCGRALARPSGGVPGVITLVLLDESAQILKRFPVNGTETTIGREGADVTFPDDPFMSPAHAVISVRDADLILRDLGSRNGTWLFVGEPHRLVDGDLLLIGSQMLRFRRLGYPGPHPPERDATRRMGSLIPSADIASLTQLRADGSARDMIHLSPGRHVTIGRDGGDWIFPYDPSMSGTHAQVRSEDADFVVVDAGSRNGVAVSVRGETPVKAGSRVLVGDKMLRVEIA